MFMCGSLSSINHTNDDNMFLYYENLGRENMHLFLIRIFLKEGMVTFKEEKIYLIRLKDNYPILDYHWILKYQK
ncbi:MAG: hypothetical protein KAH09_01705 [Desulfobacula sp.]|nr:hypothetical protein [Desulfobacula sp.]